MKFDWPTFFPVERVKTIEEIIPLILELPPLLTTENCISYSINSSQFKKKHKLTTNDLVRLCKYLSLNRQHLLFSNGAYDYVFAENYQEFYSISEQFPSSRAIVQQALANGTISLRLDSDFRSSQIS
jgi:hypothetical protein